MWSWVRQCVTHHSMSCVKYRKITSPLTQLCIYIAFRKYLYNAILRKRISSQYWLFSMHLEKFSNYLLICRCEGRSDLLPIVYPRVVHDLTKQVVNEGRQSKTIVLTSTQFVLGCHRMGSYSQNKILL